MSFGEAETLADAGFTGSSTGVLLLLERLAPTERAAYILREAFDYPYDEIGEILKVSEANARQLVTRARKHIAEGRRRRVDALEQRRLLDTFITAARKGELAPLEALFATDIVSYSDGGGLVRAAGKPIAGRERVAKFISAVAKYFWGASRFRWWKRTARDAPSSLATGLWSRSSQSAHRRRALTRLCGC